MKSREQDTVANDGGPWHEGSASVHDHPATARLDETGTVATFKAELDGKVITSERYTPGNRSARRRTAKRWAIDERLHNGEPLDAGLIVAALEQAENAALEEMDGLSRATRC